ncbi:NAD(P)/FAD-dependent oxidoreductase [Salirhabdus sp. Marseille-P4669]|uniref:NAD(P)/FAD-dependent oxidoreductase n=1 Tax=Salirhabdus sp. Marseille-P4669 TaxID=2042310 RepID=UPI00190E6983|nr:NAD(P)/FAD-dependent oxidoreductase [Salirhabdus sp. Marseille-P4669]
MEGCYDVTIIGGGPAGLFSAFYSGLRNVKTKIIEYQPKLGGKVLLYPDKLIWDVGGQPPVIGETFAKQIVEQGMTFNPTVCTNTKVDFIEKVENHFCITTSKGDKHYSKTIIMACGGGIINPKRLELKEARKYEQKNLHYTVSSIKQFANKVVLISGGGDAAIDWAVGLLPIAKKIMVVYRKEQLSAHEAYVVKVQQSDASILYNTTIKGFIENCDDQTIKKVVLQNTKTGEIHDQEVDHVIVSHGYNLEDSFKWAQNIALDKQDDYFFKGNAFGCTSEQGIFAAGDILSYQGKINLLAGAFHDAVNAVNSVKRYLEPNSNQVAMVSSHNDAFEERNASIMKNMFKEV